MNELLEKLRALRGKTTEQVLQERILFIGGPEDAIPQVPTNNGVQIYTGCPNDLIRELAAADSVNERLLGALKLLVTDVQAYEAWQRPCHALEVAEAAIRDAQGGK